MWIYVPDDMRNRQIGCLLLASHAQVMTRWSNHWWYTLAWILPQLKPSVREHKTIMKRTNHIMPGAVFMVDGKAKVMFASQGTHNGLPNYYCFTDDTKATPNSCKQVKKNPGIVFVWFRTEYGALTEKTKSEPAMNVLRARSDSMLRSGWRMANL